MKKLQISQIDFQKPDFKNCTLSKEKTLLNWFISWVEYAVQNRTVQYGDLLPSKADFARFFNVSVGTVQNAIRQAEDMGCFESKQSIGTMIKNPETSNKKFEKMFSKKDKAAAEIKKYIVDNKLELGAKLPAVKDLTLFICACDNTVRLALDTLAREGYLESYCDRGNKTDWFYVKKIVFKDYEKNLAKDSNHTRLIEKTAQKIKEYICSNYKTGDKIASNDQFAKMFSVSIRTVNEAQKILSAQKIILPRRGRYGTIYLNDPQKIKRQKERGEKSLFMSQGVSKVLQNSYLYSWETTLEALKKYILQNHDTGDKIPSMKQLAEILGVSTNTIKRAVSIMCEEGYLIAQRGRYGGVFILEMPQKESEAFTWLALNPDVVKVKDLSKE